VILQTNILDQTHRDQDTGTDQNWISTGTSMRTQWRNGTTRVSSTRGIVLMGMEGVQIKKIEHVMNARRYHSMSTESAG